MSNVYLSPWLWDSAAEEPCWIPPIPGAVGCLDLRPLPAQARAGGTPEGFGIFVYRNATTIAGAVDLGSDLGAAVKTADKNGLQSRLLLPERPQGSTLLDVIWNVLSIYGDPTGAARCKPLVPDHRGVIDLHLGGFSIVRSKRVTAKDPEWLPALATMQEDYRRQRQNAVDGKVPAETPLKMLGHWQRQFRLPYKMFIPSDLPDEGFLPPATKINDTFDRADADALGTSSDGDWSWTEVLNDIDIVSNKASQQAPSSQTQRARAEKDLSSANQYAQAVCSIAVVSLTRGGPAVRFAAAADTNYHYRARQQNPVHALYKVEAGSATEMLTDNTNGFSNDDTCRVEISGSTLTAKVNDIARLTLTDTSITGNLRTGISSTAAGSNRFTWDNFQAADLVGSRTRGTIIG